MYRLRCFHSEASSAFKFCLIWGTVVYVHLNYVKDSQRFLPSYYYGNGCRFRYYRIRRNV